MDSLTTLEDVYRAAGSSVAAARVLAAQHFYYTLAAGTANPEVQERGSHAMLEAHDLRTAEPRPVVLENVLHAIMHICTADGIPQADRFTHALGFSRRDLLHLLKNPRESIIRDQAVLPLHRVRNIHTNSLVYISRQPGNTKQEKLRACRDGIPAITRRFSLNTAENRMLKLYALHLDSICSQRADAVPAYVTGEEHEVAESLLRWFRNEEVLEICPRGPELPNNVVTGNIHYNRIWRSAGMLLELDEATTQDLHHLREIEACQAFWLHIARTAAAGAEYPQVPVYFDDGQLLIYPNAPGQKELPGHDKEGNFLLSWDESHIVKRYHGKPGKKFPIASILQGKREQWRLPAAELQPESGPLTLDFTVPEPWFADSAGYHPLPFTPRAQIRRNKNEDNQIIDLSSAKALLLQKGDRLVDCDSLLQGTGENVDGISRELRDEFPRIMAARLRRWLGLRDFTYLLPDAADDFTLTNIRRALQLEFADSAIMRAVPRSIATVLAWARNHRKNIKPETAVVVISTGHSTVTLTPLVAEEQKQMHLRKLCPHGLIWVRHPVTQFPRKNARDAAPGFHTFSSIKAGTRHLGTPASAFTKAEEDLLQRELDSIAQELRIAKEQIVILHESAQAQVDGAGVFNRFENEAGREQNAHIWKDHLPALRILYTDGYLKDAEFTLISEQTTVSPKARTFNIPINERFTLPRGQKEYYFSIRLGKKNKKYGMRLSSLLFPLAEDTECRLTLEYTYGAAQPYELRFTHLPWSVTAEWLDTIPDFPVETPPAPEVATSYTKPDGGSIRYHDCGPSILQELLSISHGVIIASDQERCTVKDRETGEQFMLQDPNEYSPGTLVHYIVKKRIALSICLADSCNRAEIQSISRTKAGSPLTILYDSENNYHLTLFAHLDGTNEGDTLPYILPALPEIHANAVLQNCRIATVSHVNKQKNYFVITDIDNGSDILIHVGDSGFPQKCADFYYDPGNIFKGKYLREDQAFPCDECSIFTVETVDSEKKKAVLCSKLDGTHIRTSFKNHLPHPGKELVVHHVGPFILPPHAIVHGMQWATGIITAIDANTGELSFRSELNGQIYCGKTEHAPYARIGDSLMYDSRCAAIRVYASPILRKAPSGQPHDQEPMQLVSPNIIRDGDGAPLSKSKFILLCIACSALMHHGNNSPSPMQAMLQQQVPQLHSMLASLGRAEDMPDDYYRNCLASLCLMARPDNPPKMALDRLRAVVGSIRDDSPLGSITDRLHPFVYCTGDLSEPWQKAILFILLQHKHPNPMLLRLISTILWQHPQAVYRLTMPEVEKIVRLCCGGMKHSAKLVAKQAEIMLALLRLRESPDLDIRAYFAAGGKGTKILRDMLNRQIEALVLNKEYHKLRTGIKLDNMEEDTQNRPPLLFVLRNYLTGEKPLSGIRITASQVDGAENID